MSTKESFEYHTLTISLEAGECPELIYKVQCHGADKDDCSCSERFCALEDQIRMVGFPDVAKSHEEIRLGRLSARMDWTDPEEPWVEVKL